jgi:glycosyltransferase involved in cell wall biosynthesis
MKQKLIRTATVSMSLQILLRGQLRYLNQYFDVIGISSGGDLHEVERNEGIKTISVDISRKIAVFKDIKSVYLLYKIFRKEKPSIVHSITPKAGLLSMLAAKISGVPIRIHTFTGLIFPSKKGLYQQLLILMDKLLCFCATNVYPEGKGVKNDLTRFHITSKPLKVLANGNVNGIDTSYFNPQVFKNTDKERLRKELKIKESDFVFIFIGRIVKDKGINELVWTFISVHTKYPDTKLLLVGPFETDLDPVLPDIEEEIHTNQSIIWTGFQSDVRPYFAISDVFVFPSYREGFPNVVMQAGAMELPAIVTDINGCNEIIVDGKNGIIIPPKDKDMLRDKMELLYENDDLRNILKSNTRKMIISRYEQKLVWDALLEEYQTLLAK